MIYKQSNVWELWGSPHPFDIGCIHEGREQCFCKYHVINKERTKIYSFEDWQKAEDKFCELTGQEKFILGKTDFQGNSLI